MSNSVEVYNLKITGESKARLEKKAKEKGMTLADYLRKLIAFSETIDEMTDDQSLITIKDATKGDGNITIPARMLKHG
jgi:hypothetical protein